MTGAMSSSLITLLMLFIDLWRRSSSTITLTGDNLTDLFAPAEWLPLEDGVLLRQDRENDEAEEHVDAFVDFSDGDTSPPILLFFMFPLAKSEFRNSATHPYNLIAYILVIAEETNLTWWRHLRNELMEFDDDLDLLETREEVGVRGGGCDGEVSGGKYGGGGKGER
ncbi:hypothetical protein SASPL_129625 [Salvia splendens]|uniref:Uncharacterized protein n=1 Tax=Salvia splendens TaxID=180675 RepID=A0A8X8ZN51_SALSN|nr:hypothetical protein SASPL_129625 [Salvia splendens]